MIKVIIKESAFNSTGYGEKILTSYNTDVIPRQGEFIYLSHFGMYRVLEVTHYISDDSVENKCMWVEIEVWKK